MPTIEEIKKLIDYSVDVKTLKAVCDKHTSDSDLQPGSPMWGGKTTFPDGTQVTWCHRGAVRVLIELGYDPTMLYYKNSIDWSMVPYMFDKAVELSKGVFSKTGVREVTAEMAFHMATFGCPCLVLSREGYGHAAVTYDEPDLVWNVGSKFNMGVMSLQDSFLKWKCKPRFFQLRKKP
jgi:hypothetical protein